MTDMIAALKKGAGVATAAMNEAAARKQQEEEEREAKLAICRTIGKPLMDFGELITGIAADEDDGCFTGSFRKRFSDSTGLRGEFTFSTKKEREKSRGVGSAETSKRILIHVEHDSGFTVFPQDTSYDRESGNRERSVSEEKEIGPALEVFAEWAGRVAPHMVPEIEAALTRQTGAEPEFIP